MSLNVNKLSDDMEKLYDNIILKSKMLSLDSFKENILDKQKYINKFIEKISYINQGSISKDVVENMKIISNEFKELYDNFDDKLMIFIVGNGNIGKSTLLNALVGEEVAKTNFLPTTWKIDVYSPDLDSNTAIIKYKDGKEKSLNINEAKILVDEEERKTKESEKIYKSKLNEESNNINGNKEKLEEIKIYLGKKYLYKSNICEVRWPVNSNWILERCLLVDTPGLFQIADHGSINNYYHKADGVIWLLDATSIANEGPHKLLKGLDKNLDNVGGVRANIIATINRIDLLRKNGGQEQVDKVYNDAVKHFENKFTDIIPLSAKQAYEGISEDNKNLIEESGILDLQKSIRNIFLSKAEAIKSNAKIQGTNRLIKNSKEILDTYKFKIDEYKKIYISKENKLNLSKEELINNIKTDLSNLINNYLSEVENRVDIYVDRLADGEGIDFIKNTIYRVNEFEKTRNSFIRNKKLEIRNNMDTWKKLCTISEYKYIQHKTEVNSLALNIKINFNNIDTSVFFKPSAEGTLMSTLGNLLGKAMFYIRKNKIKRNLNHTIRSQCENMQEKLNGEIISIIDNNYNNCINILNTTFSNVLCDFNEIESIKSNISMLENQLDEVIIEHTFEDIVGIRGKEQYLSKINKK